VKPRRAKSEIATTKSCQKQKNLGRHQVTLIKLYLEAKTEKRTVDEQLSRKN